MRTEIRDRSGVTRFAAVVQRASDSLNDRTPIANNLLSGSIVGFPMVAGDLTNAHAFCGALAEFERQELAHQPCDRPASGIRGFCTSEDERRWEARVARACDRFYSTFTGRS